MICLYTHTHTWYKTNAGDRNLQSSSNPKIIFTSLLTDWDMHLCFTQHHCHCVTLKQTKTSENNQPRWPIPCWQETKRQIADVSRAFTHQHPLSTPPARRLHQCTNVALYTSPKLTTTVWHASLYRGAAEGRNLISFDNASNTACQIHWRRWAITCRR